jgi:hypothetical protein
MAFVASEERLEGPSLHRCGAGVVVQVNPWTVQLDDDVGPTAAELLKLPICFDVELDLVAPRSRPGVGLDRIRIS